MAAIGRERELRPHWQGVRKLMLQEADVVAVSRWVRLAVLKDAKVDVTALSEPLERWMDEPPPGLVLVEKKNQQQKAMNDPTAKARTSVADRKNSSRPKPDRQLRMSIVDRKNSSRPKPDRQLRMSIVDRKNSSGPKHDRQLRRRGAAHRKPKTSLFGTDSLQSSALGIHDLWLIWF
jgi:hypothetical protein